MAPRTVAGGTRAPYDNRSSAGTYPHERFQAFSVVAVNVSGPLVVLTATASEDADL